MKCPLCKQAGNLPITDQFFDCGNCFGLYKDKKHYIGKAEEKERYKEHNNDVHDVRYQNFVSPITTSVLTNFAPGHRGLDFGCGTQPVISKVLQDNGYEIYQYDPFFADNPALLKETYDYIVSCEVIEHFHDPDAQFKLLRQMLNPNGALICMTHLYDEDALAFDSWYYKNDPTHVFIYRPETIKFIAAHYGFANHGISNRLIVLQF